MTYEEVKAINSAIINTAMCVPINSKNDLCHGLLGDDSKTYAEQGRLIIERPDGLFFVPDCDARGGRKISTDWMTFVNRMGFFYPNYIPVSELPSLEE